MKSVSENRPSEFDHQAPTQPSKVDISDQPLKRPDSARRKLFKSQTTQRNPLSQAATIYNRIFLNEAGTENIDAITWLKEIKEKVEGQIIMKAFTALVRFQALANSTEFDESVVAADPQLGEQFVSLNVMLLAKIHSQLNTAKETGLSFVLKLVNLAKTELSPFFKEMEVFWPQRVNRPTLAHVKKEGGIKEVLRQKIVDRKLNSESGNFLQEHSARFEYDLVLFAQQLIAHKLQEKVGDEYKNRADFATLPRREHYPILLKMSGKFRKIFIPHTDIFNGGPNMAAIGKTVTEAFADFENWQVLPTNPEELAKIEEEARSGKLTTTDVEKGYDNPDDFKSSYTTLSFLSVDETSVTDLSTHMAAYTHGVSTSETLVIGCRQDEGKPPKAVKLVSNNSHPYQDGKIRSQLTQKMMEQISASMSETEQNQQQIDAAAHLQLHESHPLHKELGKENISVTELRIPFARPKAGERAEVNQDFDFLNDLDANLKFFKETQGIHLNEWNLIHLALTMSLGSHSHFLEGVKGKNQIAPALTVFPEWLTRRIKEGQTLNGWQLKIFSEVLRNFAQELRDVKEGWGIIKILSSLAGKEFRFVLQKISQILDKKTDLLLDSDMVSILPYSDDLGWFTTALSDIYYRVIGVTYDAATSSIKISIKTDLKHHRYKEGGNKPITSLDVVKNLQALIEALNKIREKSGSIRTPNEYPVVKG